jgi:hypothetical protein
LELLNSLEVEKSLSSKELVFKPFIGAAGFDVLFTIAGSWHTPALGSQIEKLCGVCGLLSILIPGRAI